MFFWNSLQKKIPDEGYSRRTYLMKAIPEEHT
jgi:hypothetical protein